MLPITKPSFFALCITGLITLFVIILFIKKGVYSLDTIVLIGILLGVHGLLHLGLEMSYDFNPLEMMIRKTPQTFTPLHIQNADKVGGYE